MHNKKFFIAKILVQEAKELFFPPIVQRAKAHIDVRII